MPEGRLQRTREAFSDEHSQRCLAHPLRLMTLKPEFLREQHQQAWAQLVEMFNANCNKGDQVDGR